MTCTLERFQKDTAEHQLTISLDEGLHRNLRISRPQSSAYHYNITTWPGYLCISGDMGCFVFQRVEDMFTFFRGKPDEINPGYWQEKVQAGAGFEGSAAITAEPDFAAYDKRLMEYLDDFIDGLDPDVVEDAEKIEQATEAVEYFKKYRENSEWDIVSRINNWDASEAGGMVLEDFWEGHRSLQKFSFHYIWCCYAIVHAIALYDAVKASEVAHG
ncbi:hypothetical protein [Rheinheimera aquimaris]|uniref:hypothetical protein n=1 Tax=Rheinheimera aquimaris TaxID=412437 RepID=UPI003A979FEB